VKLQPFQKVHSKSEELNRIQQAVESTINPLIKAVEDLQVPITVQVQQDYQAKASDRIIICLPATQAYFVRLPPAQSMIGLRTTIKRMGQPNAVEVIPVDGETIDGATSYVLSTAYAVITFLATRFGWVRI